MKHINLMISALLGAAMLVSCAGGGGEGADSTETGAETTASTDISFSYSDGIDENGKLIDVNIADHVTLCDYKGITVPKDEHTATEEEIDLQFDSILSAYPDITEIKDRAVADGDTVNIDYIGSVDGVEFDGGSTQGNGTDVTIGVTNYIDDFLEQLIDHMPGETFNVEVTFPDPYPSNTSLSGKDAVFVTTINYIVEESTPEITEDFLAENFPNEDWKTEDDMRAGIAKEISDDKVNRYISTYLLNNCTVTVPDSTIEYQKNSILNYYSNIAAQYGYTLDDYLTAGGFATRDAFLSSYSNDIENAAKNILIYQAIAEKEGITADENDVVAFLKKNISSYTDSMLENYKSSMGMPYLMQAAIRDKVDTFLFDNVVLG